MTKKSDRLTVRRKDGISRDVDISQATIGANSTKFAKLDILQNGTRLYCTAL
jgi:hypothetical protein